MTALQLSGMSRTAEKHSAENIHHSVLDVPNHKYAQRRKQGLGHSR